MRKYLAPIVFCSVIVSFILIAAITSIIKETNNYVHITDLDYKAEVVDSQVGDKGKIVVTERLTFEIHAASSNNTFWELWRDLPEEYVDGAKVEYNVLSVKRLTTNGQPDYLEFGKAAELYWGDEDYISTSNGYGPYRWFHSKGPYDGEYNFECVLFYVDGLYRETVVFELQYEMINASLRYGDCSELYMSLFSGESVKYLNSLNAQILIPTDKMPSGGNYDAYTYGTNAHEFDLIESDTLNAGYHTFAFSLDKTQLNFKRYNRYIEFALIAHGIDKHKFTQFASNNYYYNSDRYSYIQKAQADYEALPAISKIRKITLLCVFTVLTLVLISVVFVIAKLNKKKYKFPAAAQKFDFYKEIPSELDAVFAGALCFCKHRYSDMPPGGFAAALLGLVQKGYVDLTQTNLSSDWNQDNTNLVVNKTKFNSQTGKILLPPLTKTEELYYSLVRRHAEKYPITLAQFQERVAKDYDYTESFNRNMKSSVKNVGVLDGYLREPDYKKVKKSIRNKIILFIVLGSISLIANAISVTTRLDLAFGAFFVLGIGFYLAAALLGILSQKHVLLTQLGEDEYQKWRGLYKYLNSETLMNEREVPDIAIWEEYLLYATSFGIPEKVIKALKVKFPEYSLANSRVVGHPYFRTRAFTRMYVRSARSSVRRASFSSRVGSHMGGYGGGGRGGGGGGGGH